MHPTGHRFRLGITLAATLAASTLVSAQQSTGIDMTPVKPESVGFSSERLENLHRLMQDSVDKKQINGMVTILARHGKVVDYRVYGKRDIEAGTPMTTDTLFRIFSMTKPVTAVAMLMLYEEGKFLPTDPIAKYIPEFANLKVYKGTDASGRVLLVDPDHQPTIAELMSHTAGFTYGLFGNTPVDQMYREQKVMQSKDLQEFINRLARIPLLYQPGHGWTYSVSMDIEGYLVEKLSGKTLPEFYQERIFKPLGMKDAAFFVPAEKRARFAPTYWGDEAGNLKVNNSFGGDFAQMPSMPSGGGGMVATAEDYLRFAQMLANGGSFNGHRLLAPSTVKLMGTNHVPQDLIDARQYGIGQQFLRPGFGYGYNCAVVYDPGAANLTDGKGTFFWDGAAGTWYWVDPTNDIVFVGMIQRMGANAPPLQYESHALVYQALVDPAE